MVKHDVHHGAGTVHDVLYVHDDPPGPNLDGELLHAGGPGEPQVQVQGRCAVRLQAAALGVPFELCIVKALLSPTSGR